MDYDAEAAAIKALGSVWGSQDGLLSVAELALLMRLVGSESGPLRVLEVGHYHGLSTCAMVRALAGRDDWSLTTLDSHEKDAWVKNSDAAICARNRAALFDSDRLTTVHERSQTLVAPLPFDVVFYDGDHAEEQRRFTLAVIDSPDVRLFLFDDRDFAFPAECCAMLRAAGWRDESPPLRRKYGDGDKMNAHTQTLGVFRRGLS